MKRWRSRGGDRERIVTNANWDKPDRTCCWQAATRERGKGYRGRRHGILKVPHPLSQEEGWRQGLSTWNSG
jgi:hypothetical protein